MYEVKDCGDNFPRFRIKNSFAFLKKTTCKNQFFCVLWTCVGIGVCRLCRNSICIGFPFKPPRFQSAPYFPFSITTFSFYTNDIFFLFIIICFWSISKALSSDFMNIFFLFLSRLPCSFIFSPSHVVHLNFVCFIFRFLLELPPLKLFYDQSISYCPSCFFLISYFFWSRLCRSSFIFSPSHAAHRVAIHTVLHTVYMYTHCITQSPDPTIVQCTLYIGHCTL